MEHATPLSPILYAKVLGSGGGGGGSGMTEDFKQALLDCFNHVAWTDEHGQDYVDALEAALYPLVRITAVYTQSGTVYDTDSLDSLRADLVVTATYQGGQTQTVTTYTLSGTLTVGTSTITVSYGGKTTTFTVTVTHNDVLYSLASPATLSADSDSINTGVVADAENAYTMLIDMTIGTLYGNSSATGAKSQWIFTNAGTTGDTYQPLRTEKITSGNMAGKYLWNAIYGIGWDAGKNIIAEGDRIKMAITFDFPNLTITNHFKNVTAGTSNDYPRTLTGTASSANGNPWQIGFTTGRTKASEDAGCTPGTYSVFKIYDRILTAEEIAAFLNNGA